MNCKGKCCNILVCSFKLHVSCKSGRLKQALFSLSACLPAIILHIIYTELTQSGGTCNLSRATFIKSSKFAKIFWGVLYIGPGSDFFGVGGAIYFFWDNAWWSFFFKKNKTRTSWEAQVQDPPYLCHIYMLYFELFLNENKPRTLIYQGFKVIHSCLNITLIDLLLF